MGWVLFNISLTKRTVYCSSMLDFFCRLFLSLLYIELTNFFIGNLILIMLKIFIWNQQLLIDWNLRHTIFGFLLGFCCQKFLVYSYWIHNI